MKHLKYTLIFISACIIFSCDRNEIGVPNQPDFITIGLEAPYTVEIGTAFELSVPEEEGAESYVWTLPESFNVLSGENTARITVASMETGTIAAGTISVAAVNSAGQSYSRTLWLDIIITDLAPEPDHLQISIKGSLAVWENETFTASVPYEPGITYDWTISDKLTLVSGAGSEIITLKPAGTENIPAGAIKLTETTSTGLKIDYTYDKMLVVIAEDYPAKRYGEKVWMTKNLDYAGETGDVGKHAPTETDADGSRYGRYYTWDEAMTGKKDVTAPYVYNYSGVDDMGNEFTMDYTAASHNVQIRGICPEGWHVPNAYDFYDLVAGIASDYGVEKSSMSAVQSAAAGIYMAPNRETGPMTSMTLTTYGPVASYVRGSGPDVEGGLWKTDTGTTNGGRDFTYNSITYKMYYDETSEIGFNILPGGQYTDGADTFSNEGRYSYHWTATVISSGNHYRFTVGRNNCNFSTGNEGLKRNNIRCVVNY